MKLISISLFAVLVAASTFSVADMSMPGLGGSDLEGKRLYDQRCSTCHGVDGAGRSGMAPNFHDEWHRLTKSDSELFRNVRNGFRTPGKFYSSGQCPSQQLSDQDISNVLTHLRRLSGQ